MFSIFRAKNSIAEAGLLQDMVDIHTHLLYGVDDGVQTKEQSLAALDYLERQGLRQIYLTPHIMDNFPDNNPESLNRHFETFSSEYKGNIDLRLSAEYMLDNKFKSHLDNSENKLLSLGTYYLLVETSYVSPPLYFFEMIKQIKNKGYYIILAHPERYQYMDKSDYTQLKKDGFLFFQLNLLSPAGYYGKQVQEKAEFLLNNDFYTFTGSDIHNLELHTQAYNQKSFSDKQITKIRTLIENNREFLQ
jgi:tyrosine-protein phosphatase YwqE